MQNKEEKLSFSILTDEEVEKFSAEEVHSLSIMDQDQNPVLSGLHGTSMGATIQRQTCRTCNGDTSTCMGHFGHIKLPIVCLNPVFAKELCRILNLFCHSCFRIQTATSNVRIFIVQSYLINEGRVSECSKWNDLWNCSEDKLEELHNELRVIEKEIKHCSNNELLSIKNSNSLYEELKRKFVSYVVKRKLCIHCRVKMEAYRLTDYGIIKAYVGNFPTTYKNDFTLMADDIKTFLRVAWKKLRYFIRAFYPIFRNVNYKYPTDIFFMENILVPPLPLRPPNFLNTRVFENHQTTLYNKLLFEKKNLEVILELMKISSVEKLSKANQNIIKLTKGDTVEDKFNFKKNSLQLSLNRIYDSNIKSYMNPKGGSNGIRQILEKKDGMFRLMMMGKRANFSARTVITPDGSIDVDEIGVPLAFAKELTYPVKVTDLNYNQIKKMVLNGPDKYPGARFIDQGDGHIRIIPGGDSFEMKAKRRMYAKTLLTPIHWDLLKEKKTVYRHLIDGDMVIMNRQPTLHRSSMLAHRVRVLRDEKTLRLHYAVCKGYNSDFDGDEMNLHCVQDDISKAELKYLTSVNWHYSIPKNGTPLNGLIQDHIIAAFNLTLRDKFFTFDEYLRLVYHGLSNNKKIKLLPPAIMKPGKYWTGKQIFSTIILNTLPKSKNYLTLSSTSMIKLPSPYVHLSDSTVYFLNGQLMTGVLDKNHIGGSCYSLIHCVNELYGGERATRLLSSISRMLTLYLSMIGYNLGFQCMLLKKDIISQRKEIIKKGGELGKTISAQVLKIPQDQLLTYRDEDILFLLEKSCKLDLISKINLDNVYQEKLGKFTKQMEKLTANNGFLYNGIKNELQLMVMSGAKGNQDNITKITNVFGQMVFDGKRPGLNYAGRSLPMFEPYSYHPMAGGYIFSNVTTGLLHSDTLFTCTAGREGLIDTAIKTSSSGYLQRCLMKHLESLIVHYDGTVRDSDGSIIQFLYGEDGLDVTKSAFLNYNQLEFLMLNSKVILNEESNNILESIRDKKVKEYRRKYSKYLKKMPEKNDRRSSFLEYSKQCPGRDKKWLMKKWYNSSDDVKKACQKLLPKHMDPINSLYSPQRYLESCSDKALKLINAKVAELKEIGGDYEQFEKLMFYKLNSSLVESGEPVGCLAAQSLGEPSTQMTLNTFHFAGSVDQNVTLGMPRLLEILKTAPKSIKTPYVDVPFHPEADIDAKSQKILSSLRPIPLTEVLKHIDVLDFEHPKNMLLKNVHLILFLRDHDSYQNFLTPKPKIIIKNILTSLLKPLFKMINQYIRIAKKKNSSMEAISLQVTEDLLDDDLQEVGFKSFQQRASNNIDQAESSDSEHEDDYKNEKNMETNSPDFENYYDNEAISESEDEQEHEDENQFDNYSDNELPVAQEKTTFKMKKLINYVLDISKLIKHFDFDKDDYSWCVVQFEIPKSLMCMNFKYILLTIARSSFVQTIKDIKNATTYRKENGELILRTQGTNFDEVFKYVELLDINRIYCNDIYKIQTMYGIEAARNAIIKEVKNVFAAYKIVIDYRHLSLVADYLTHNGFYSGFNRFSMSNCASTMQKTTFETSMQFLKQTILEGKSDPLVSSSGCIMIGKRPIVGTAIFDLLEDKKAIKAKKDADRKYANKFRKQFEQMNRDFIEKYNAVHEDKMEYTSCIKQEDYTINEEEENNNTEHIIPFS